MKLLKDMWGHEHPLILKEDHKHVAHEDDDDDDDEDESDGYPEDRSCEACKEPIFIGPYYDCSECVFVLHKSCAELPQKMDHPAHPSHTLTLLLTREIQEYWNLKWIKNDSPVHTSNLPYELKDSCDVCGDLINYKCIYSCSTCNFQMDIVCASLNERKIQHPSHQHPLFPLGQPISCKCNACGEEHADEGIFYHCKACPIFFIHKDCASLSGSINRRSHEHPLKLAYSLPSQFSHFKNICDNCAKDIEIQWRYWVYCCVGCRYISHLNCKESSKSHEPPSAAGLYWEWERWIGRHSSVDDGIQLPVSDESVTLISYFLKDTSDLQRKNDGATSSKLNHFSHDHPLILFDGEIHEIESGSRGKVSRSPYSRRDDDETLCGACVKPVLATTPFYRCEESSTRCNFFLHKCCAELPMQINHPLDSRLPLILLPKCPEFFGLFICSGCKYFCNGFIYSCGDSRYCLDVTCAFLPRIVKHVAHPYHVLSLRCDDYRLRDEYNKYCLSDDKSKRCVACSQLVESSTDFVYSCDIVVSIWTFTVLYFHKRLGTDTTNTPSP